MKIGDPRAGSGEGYRYDYHDDTEELHCECLRSTPLALLVLIDGEEEWIPRSQISADSTVLEAGDEGTLLVRSWFCVENDLV